MGINESPDRADVNDTGFTSLVVAVSTTQVELKTSTTRDPKRQIVTVTNDSDTTEVYFGPTGVTATGSTKGSVLWPRQDASIPLGDVAIFAIAPSGTVNVIVQEYR